MNERTRKEIKDAIEDVRWNMPWSDDRDSLLNDLYGQLAEVPVVLQSLNNLGTACPSQWTGTTVDGEDVYVRFRWGHLTVTVGDDLVYSEQVSDDLDGVMATGKMLELTGLVGPE